MRHDGGGPGRAASADPPGGSVPGPARRGPHAAPSRWHGDLRLVPSAAAAWTAAAVAVHGGAVGATAAGLLAGACALMLSCLVVIVPGRRRAWALLPGQALAPAAALSLVLLSAGGSLARAEAGPVDEALDGGVPFTAVLRITGEPSSLGPGAFGGGKRYLVDAEVLGGVLRGAPFVAATPVVVLGPGGWAGVGTGDTVRVLGTAEPADRVGRAAAIFLPASSPAIEEARGWLGYTDHLRTRFRDLALADSRDGGLLPGMALGDRTGLAPDLEEAMRRTGLTHLTAVSGANCSYVVAFAFLGLRVLRLPRLPAGVGAVVSLVAFVLLVRPEPSVLRAAVMGAVGVAAVLSGRGRVSLTLLMVSVIVLLAVDPWLSVSFAFVLSVAATLGLVTAGPTVVDTLGLMMPRPAAQLLAIPLTAQLFCTPILVLIQPALPVYSLPANVLVSPVVPAITLVGMAAVVALVAGPVLAPALIATAQWGTRWVAGVAEALAAAPAATVPWFPGAPGAVVAASGSVLLLLAMVRRESVLAGWRRAVTRTRQPPSVPTGSGTAGRPPARAGRRTVAIVLAVALLGALATIALVDRRGTGSSARWALTMCDVGQGDGMVIRTSAEHALVVDTGPDPDAMDRCLDALGIEVIDALVITHLHDDHYGGVEGALRGRTVSALYYSTGEDGLPRELTDATAGAGVGAERLTGATRLDLPPVRVDVLWPRGETRLPEENNASAVLQVVVPTAQRPLTLLLTGDLEEDAAAELLAAVPSLRDGGVDILKIAHHGARNGGTGIIDAVSPALALISVGKDNDYGHPHPRILERLDRSGIASARTDELGSFTVGVTDGRIEVHRLR